MALQRKETSRVGTKTDSATKGLGNAGNVEVKGVRATAAQRRVIDGILTEAHSEKASPRVMTAMIMTATQESGLTTSATNGSHVGPFQQDPNWGSTAERRDPTRSARAFLAAWKKAHGSVKSAPGNLAAAIESVQRSGQGSLYARWEKEATATVATWTGSDDFSDGANGRTYAKRYEFTRGERHGARETSWDAMARLAEEVGFRRWAATNVLFYVSEDELRAGAPSVEIHGDEAWLLGKPQWDWGSKRAVSECTIRVLADRWSILPGAVVMLSTPGPTKGRWLVKSVSGQRLDSPEVDVILKRPTRHKPEPAHDTATSDSGGGTSSELLTVCKAISGQNRAYLYGGGHGKPLTSIEPHDPLDCSSSVSLALSRANMFNGQTAITSGEFASSWGKPGKGRDFSVMANATHVFLEGYDADGKPTWRFDTSGTPRGPHVRSTARADQARFTARHWS